jgi:hypothetical protein
MKKDSTQTPDSPMQRAIESAMCERWTMKGMPLDVRKMMAKAIKLTGRDTKKSLVVRCVRQGIPKILAEARGGVVGKRDAAAQGGNVQ